MYFDTPPAISSDADIIMMLKMHALGARASDLKFSQRSTFAASLRARAELLS